MRKLFVYLSCFVFYLQVEADEKVKVTYEISRAALAPRIDGKPDDECWKSATIATNFITYSPVFGKPASLKTEARIIMMMMQFMCWPIVMMISHPEYAIPCASEII